MAEKGKKREQYWENVRKCHGCKGEFLPAVHTDDSTFLLERLLVESDGWFAVSPHLKYKL